MQPRTDIVTPDAGMTAALVTLAAMRGQDAFWDVREAAMTALRERGLPRRTDEEWKYLSLGDFYREVFTPVSSAGQAVDMAAVVASMGAADEPHLVLVDGIYAPALSQLSGLKGVTVTHGKAVGAAALDRQDARQGDNPFVHANRALLSDVVVVRVERHALVAKPLHLMMLSTGTQSRWAAPHIGVHVEEGAQLTLMESYHGQAEVAQALTAVYDIRLAPQAVLDHVRWQAEKDHSYVFTDTEAHVAAGARWQQWAFDVGARVARHNLEAVIAGSQAEVILGGLYLVDGKRQVDHHTLIDHRIGQSQSQQFYKGLVTEAGRAIFNGKVKIRQDAQQTEAHQLCRNLMLSDDAEVYAKPELEIDADDVKCSHGTTVSQVSDQEIFYLQSRGIRRQDAVALLSHAFANEVLMRIAPAALAARMTRLFEGHFRGFGKGGHANDI